MKVSSDIPQKTFKPFTLSIEVETVQELVTLWKRFNVSVYKLNEINKGKYERYLYTDTDIIWSFIDKELRSLGEDIK